MISVSEVIVIFLQLFLEPHTQQRSFVLCSN